MDWIQLDSAFTAPRLGAVRGGGGGGVLQPRSRLGVAVQADFFKTNLIEF